MRIAIVGTAGVPAAYGGFETLAENIVRFNQDKMDGRYSITVFCSRGSGDTWCGADLVHLKISANGFQSILYDLVSLVIAVRKRADVILVLGVSGALFFPLIRFFSRAKLVVNVDGIEWKRAKWGPISSMFLKCSEWVALRHADAVIADNPAVKRYLESRSRRECDLIAYGGDHALVSPALPGMRIPKDFYFSVCRIEPENNVDLILEGFAAEESLNIVVVGNWSASDYGLATRRRFSGFANIVTIDPIYDLHVLSYFRTNAVGYIHGHSAGGTNPALVEAMHFGRPIFAFDCSFNRETTQNQAYFFASVDELRVLLRRSKDGGADGNSLREIARENFTWDHVARQYFSLFDAVLKRAQRVAP